MTNTQYIEVQGSNITSDVTIALSGSEYFTLSQTVIPFTDILVGTVIAVTYEPLLVGTHTATLTLYSDEISSTTVALTGSAYDDFKALQESELTNASFVANWTRHSQAASYELSVWQKTVSDAVPTDIFDVSFASGAPSGWSTGGYTNVESSSIRMASGNNDGTVVSPAIDLSQGGELTVTCAPYKTSDNSVLYILVDGVEVAQIDCASSEVTQTVTLAAATSSSTITFKAVKSRRVYLKSASLVANADSVSWKMLDGYPLNVGNVTSYSVENLDITTTYRYQVQAVGASDEVLATSDYIELTTYELPTSVKESITPQFYVYSYNGTIYIDDAPANSRVNVYSLDGTLCMTRTLHSVREVLTTPCSGIYVVQVVTNRNSYTYKVAVL